MHTKIIKAEELKRFDRIRWFSDVVYVVDNVMIGPTEVVVQFSYLGQREALPIRYKIGENVVVYNFD